MAFVLMPSRRAAALRRKPTLSWSRISATLVFVIAVLGWLYSAPSHSPGELVVARRDAGVVDRNSSVAAVINKRGNDPNTPNWASRVTTGRMLWCLFANTGATQSPWTSTASLARWGWVPTAVSENTVSNTFQAPVAAAYAQYGITAASDKAVAYSNQDNFLDDDGDEQEATMGYYQNLVNGPSGSIVAGDNYSPADMYAQFNGGKQAAPNELPDLRQWSDLVGLQWQVYAPGATLKYVLRSNVANSNTKTMIQTAFQNENQATIPTYPGKDFTINADGTGPQAEEFYGLLGTYHGAGPAYLIAQHRALFGQMRIRTIRVWNQQAAWTVGGDMNNLAPCMMFFVESVPAPAPA